MRRRFLVALFLLFALVLMMSNSALPRRIAGESLLSRTSESEREVDPISQPSHRKISP